LHSDWKGKLGIGTEPQESTKILYDLTLYRSLVTHNPCKHCRAGNEYYSIIASTTHDGWNSSISNDIVDGHTDARSIYDVVCVDGKKANFCTSASY